MKRPIPWVDFIFYGALMLLSLSAAILVSCREQPVGALVSVWAAAAGFLAVFLVIFVGWFVQRPSFYVRGTAVWDAGVRFITPDNMNEALEFYAKRFPELLRELDLPEKDLVTTESIASMFMGACVEWTDKSISIISRFWQIKDANGLQQGRCIMVRWMGSISKSALFHELNHMVDEVILKRAPDYKHENEYWWAIVNQLKEDFEI